MKTWLSFALLIPVCGMVLGLMGKGFLCNCVVTLSCALIAALTGRGEMMIPLIAAFIISVLGDWFMNHKSGNTMRYILAISLFFLAHIGFTVYAASRFSGSARIYICGVLLMLLLGWYMAGRVLPKIPEIPMKAAVAVYALVSLVSLVCAAALKGNGAFETLLYSFGIAMLVASDLMICENDFVHHTRCFGYIMPLYYLSHIFIAASAVAGMA